MNLSRSTFPMGVHKGGHSATVNLRLIVGDHEIPPAHVGVKTRVARTAPSSLPERDAVLAVDIDGQVTRHHVHLLHGAIESSREIDFVCYANAISRSAQL